MSKFIAYRVSDGYIVQWQDDEQYNYPEKTNGVDVVEITESQYDSRMEESWYVKGKISSIPPTPKPLPEKSAEDVALSKRLAHANTVSGSDHLFIAAMRLKLNEDENWEQAVTLANKRYNEIEEDLTVS